MPMLEGLDESTCEELQEAHSAMEETKEAIGHHVREDVEEFLQSDDRDIHDALEEADLPVDEESLKGLHRIQRKVRYTASLGCGLSYASEVDTDYDLDGDEIPDEVVEDAYETVDEAGRKVRETTPDYIVSDDIAYREIAGEENQKRVFQDHANRTLDSIEKFADSEDIDLSDRETTGTAVAMQIECGKLPTEEAQQECYDRFEQFDVKSSGLRGPGETIPGGV